MPFLSTNSDDTWGEEHRDRSQWTLWPAGRASQRGDHLVGASVGSLVSSGSKIPGQSGLGAAHGKGGSWQPRSKQGADGMTTQHVTCWGSNSAWWVMVRLSDARIWCRFAWCAVGSELELAEFSQTWNASFMELKQVNHHGIHGIFWCISTP